MGVEYSLAGIQQTRVRKMLQIFTSALNIKAGGLSGVTFFYSCFPEMGTKPERQGSLPHCQGSLSTGPGLTQVLNSLSISPTSVVHSLGNSARQWDI